MNTDTNGSVFSSKDMEEFAKYFWRKHQDKESLSLEATVGGDLIEWIIGPDTKEHSVSDEEIKISLLDKNGFDFDAFEFENEFSAKAILKAMDEYRFTKSTTEPIKDEHEWIDVNDRLPEYDVKVLAFGEQMAINPQMGGAYICISFRQDLSKTSMYKNADRLQDKNQFRLMSYVKYWQPLPKLPNQ